MTCALYGCIPATITQHERGGVGSLQESFGKVVLDGSAFPSLDNLRGKLDTPAIESAATEDYLQVRLPYCGLTPVDMRRICIMATSNRAELTIDFANRCSVTRIKKRSDAYRFRKFAGGRDLLDEVREKGPLYLGAVFSIVRAWHQKGKARLEEVSHDFRPWARTLGWIVREILDVGDLLADHRAAQARTANPLLTWARDIALAVQRSGRLDKPLRPHEILEIAVGADLNDADLDDDEARQKGNLAMGQKLGRLMSKREFLAVDGWVIHRRAERDTEARTKWFYTFSSTVPNLPQSTPNQNQGFPNAPNGRVNSCEASEAFPADGTHTSVPGAGGIGGRLGDDGDELLPATPSHTDCRHEWHDTPVNGQVKTSCRHCDKFLGYRPIESKA